MSRPILFEVIATSVDDAVAAVAGGADRLEVVTDMAADGLSVAPEEFARIRAAVPVPLRVMVRQRDGFAAGDLDALRHRAERLRAEGADEFVLGFLDAAGAADLPALRAVLEVLGGCRWTFHRALDGCADRSALRRAVAGLPGLDTFLTAGSPAGVDSGRRVLAEEAARHAAGEPGHAPRVLVGGGLRREHLPELVAAGLDAFHVGGAVRHAGWDSPVDPAAVRSWREELDGLRTAAMAGAPDRG
ncbi:copper homeostasis protein CutC [Allostreptomyces psammosilenae]|uniref:Copper homeostasis protein cutC homolog n=1 Tax=Allostreptomyces psammosilenae TaxID=1892865 RepID=A0A853A2F1_9ACTN|nr:copper homeostasis protein CutC [Allostreptomyces psammosilenae]NYI07640.1 copper homeostasis protein [Allostreptomyces psammosilenae]